MKILAFDTTNNLASVAVMENDSILAYCATQQSSQQAEKLFHLIDKALKESGFSLSDIDIISVTNGPGSFTGVRVGLAAALGMQMNVKAKFIAITNFQVIAYQAKEKGQDIAVLIDARRDQFYLQMFNSQLEALTNPALLNQDDLKEMDLKNIILLGDGTKHLNNQSSGNLDAAMLAKSVYFYFKNNMYSPIEPLYVRDPDAKLN